MTPFSNFSLFVGVLTQRNGLVSQVIITCGPKPYLSLLHAPPPPPSHRNLNTLDKDRDQEVDCRLAEDEQREDTQEHNAAYDLAHE